MDLVGDTVEGVLIVPPPENLLPSQTTAGVSTRSPRMAKPIDVRRRSVRHVCYMNWLIQAIFQTGRKGALTRYRTSFERAGRRKSQCVRRVRRSPAHQYPPLQVVGSRYRTTWTDPSLPRRRFHRE